MQIVWDGSSPSDGELTAALDLLLFSHSELPHVVDCNKQEPNFEDLLDWETVAKRFPDYGFYSEVEVLNLNGPDHLVGDAVDDVLDISRDMQRTVFYADKGGLELVQWWFGLTYFHWGNHARNLSRYLFARQFG